MVSIPTCHAGDSGLILGNGAINLNDQKFVNQISDMATKDSSVPGSSNAKNLFESVEIILLLLAYDNILKIQFGLNHCKCIGHTSNKVDYKSKYHSHKD